MTENEKRLLAALYVAHYSMHPFYPNTAGWRGGIGGSMITQGCSHIDPPHGNEGPKFALDEILRDSLRSLDPAEEAEVLALATQITSAPDPYAAPKEDR